MTETQYAFIAGWLSAALPQLFIFLGILLKDRIRSERKL